MSTLYELGKGYVADERSSKISLGIRQKDGDIIFGPPMEETGLNCLIVNLVKAYSYIAEDQQDALCTFNVDLGD